MRSNANTQVFYPSGLRLVLATWGIPRTEIAGSAISMGMRRRSEGSKTWKAPGMKGGNVRRGGPCQSPCSSHCDPIIAARASDTGAPQPPCQFHAPFPAKIPRPTHLLRSSKGSPPSSKPLALFPRCRGQELLPSVATATTEHCTT